MMKPYKKLILSFIALLCSACAPVISSSESSKLDSDKPSWPSFTSLSSFTSETSTSQKDSSSAISSNSSSIVISSYKSNESSSSKSSENISSSSSEESSMENLPKNYPISFENIKRCTDVQKYISAVKNTDGSWYNGAVSTGLIKSPYYSIVCGEYGLPVYAACVTYGAHSFAYIVKEEATVTLDITFDETITECQILSCSNRQPILSFNGNKIKTTLFEERSYTIIPNKNKQKSITIFVEPKIEYIPTKEYNENILQPGRYEQDLNVNEYTTLYFKKGYYEISKIALSSNTRIFFEDGVYIKAINPADLGETPTVQSDHLGLPRYKDFIVGENISNVDIKGHGIIDFYSLDFHSRKPLYFLRCENISVSDILLNNAVEWNTYNAVSKNINYCNCKIFGYRMNSDGYAFIDSQDCTIRNCFARSGDDLFEVKSMYGNETQEIKNVVFEECVGWPDKARGMGMISESKRLIKDCKWKNSIICWYEPKWMDALGALVMICDSGTNVAHQNNTFENIQIFNNSFYPINITISKDTQGRIYNTAFRNITVENDYKIRLNNANTTSKIDGVLFENVKIANKKVTDISSIFIDGTISDLQIK